MIWHKYKCIFIHIPKTAGTTIEKMFEAGGDEYITLEKHIKAANMAQKYHKQCKSYFKFSVIRNPWDRIYSIWYNLYLTKKTPLCFSDYVFDLPNSNYLTDSQVSWLKGMKIDKIWRYESIEHTFNALIAQFDLPNSIPHMKQISDKPNFREFYDEESIEVVSRLYKDDIDTWGYSFENKEK